MSTMTSNEIIEHICSLIEIVKYQERNAAPLHGDARRIRDVKALTWACERLHAQHPKEFRAALEMCGVPKCWA